MPQVQQLVHGKPKHPCTVVRQGRANVAVGQEVPQWPCTMSAPRASLGVLEIASSGRALDEKVSQWRRGGEGGLKAFEAVRTHERVRVMILGQQHELDRAGVAG